MLSIVVPTYNEKENIAPLCQRINSALGGAVEYEIIFVDDSTDDTPNVISALGDDHVRLFHRENEKGLATAVIKGFEISNGDYVACMDADLQHPPEILFDMYIAMLSGSDMVIPSRFIPGGSDGGLDIVRKIISGSARYIGKIMLPSLRKITDPTSGLFMVKRDLIKGADLRPIGWKIMVEVLAMCNIRRVIEIPYKFCDRNAGESKISAKVSMEYIKQLLRLVCVSTNKGKMEVERWNNDMLKSMKESYKERGNLYE